ncbi:hypothetical protein [Sulfobacillus harzensis]|uniref:Uncharacterized protein n=1 Tax=Sulfobacillus harzensis TaxID=2729629 RepID=A0A7Y0L5Q1_9FIRM|nr:hypothetical protein [Sulfobacillus harzensis]NMP23774.1 hypothetical protein [Sulfobacillus harzensis]
MSVQRDPHRPSESVLVTGTRVMISELVIDEPKLAQWLGELTPEDRAREIVDIVRLGLAMKMNNQIRELNESLKHTTEATLEQLGARMQTSIVEMEGKLKEANQGLNQLLSQSVTGDNSQLKVTMAKTFEEMRQGLAQTRYELVQALDPRNTESIGAQLEARIRQYIQNLAQDSITPKLDAVAQAVGKLETALQGQERLKQERLKGHSKGAEYEVDLLEAIQDFAVPSTMLVRRVADEKGINGSKDGDLVIEYDSQTLVTIECKDSKTSKLDQLESAIVGRQAQIGIMAFKQPTGPSAHMSQGSARIVGDNKILLVWDPEQDDPALLTAVVGLSLLLAQKMEAHENRNQDEASTLDLPRAQGALEVMVEKLDLVGEVVRHFDLIRSNADKGQKVVERLKKEVYGQAMAAAAALGLDIGD